MFYNGLRLSDGGNFHHKCVCGAHNRHFCQTRIANLNINTDYNIKITELPTLDNGYKSKSFQETSFLGIIL